MKGTQKPRRTSGSPRTQRKRSTARGISEPPGSQTQPEDDIKPAIAWHWSNLIRLRWEIVFSVLSGLAVFASAIVWPSLFDRADLKRVDLIVAFLLGIASILALVGSITFGFLLYYTQSVADEKHDMYSRFKDGVKDLRTFLEELRQSGTIDDSYDFHFGLLEEIALKDFPLSHWSERVDPFLKVITDDQRSTLEANGEFGRVLRGVAYRLNTIEENVSGLFENFVKQVLVSRMVEPVLKSFVTLAIVVLLVLVAPFAFGAWTFALTWAFSVMLAFMTFLLLIEMALIVRRETRDLYDFGQSAAVPKRQAPPADVETV